ncbi:5758_t:CDS:1, partial [Paraglomus brasilianum]
GDAHELRNRGVNYLRDSESLELEPDNAVAFRIMTTLMPCFISMLLTLNQLEQMT